MKATSMVLDYKAKADKKTAEDSPYRKQADHLD
jgi:hypothetical protein